MRLGGVYMSCDIGDAVEKLKDITVECNEFNYVDGKKRKGIQEHTKEEYVEFIENLANDTYDQYERTAMHLGWIRYD